MIDFESLKDFETHYLRAEWNIQKYPRETIPYLKDWVSTEFFGGYVADPEMRMVFVDLDDYLKGNPLIN